MAHVDRAAHRARILRDSAKEFRQHVGGGIESPLNSIAADLLDRRAARIAAGEEDHSLVQLRYTAEDSTHPEALLE
ncbi:hypothetical protein KZC51_12390 [Microbacterium sp. SSW1-49]|uniref:Uncharacterized protein n=1 Tax=Microbacterium croceum TaxID=2851645 RepID=A0ABT0FGU4_9MICO|nr:hypothetical protein [Microbacterium croceum]MCK2036932.1 hypothetical protein [Microbacterium croceum]